jgi:hypothetical protein
MRKPVESGRDFLGEASYIHYTAAFATQYLPIAVMIA